MLKNYTFILVSIILINSSSYCVDNNNLHNAVQYFDIESIKASLGSEDLSCCKIDYTKQKNYVKLKKPYDKSKSNSGVDCNNNTTQLFNNNDTLYLKIEYSNKRKKEDYLITYKTHINYINKMYNINNITQNCINSDNIYFQNQYFYYEQNRHIVNRNMKHNKFERQLNNDGIQKFNPIIYNNYPKHKYKLYKKQNNNKYTKYNKDVKYYNTKFENTKEGNK